MHPAVPHQAVTVLPSPLHLLTATPALLLQLQAHDAVCRAARPFVGVLPGLLARLAHADDARPAHASCLLPPLAFHLPLRWLGWRCGRRSVPLQLVGRPGQLGELLRQRGGRSCCTRLRPRQG